jgi:hypothetical protein
MAYDAARTLSLMIVRAEGYRPRSAGGHYNTFLALEAADPSFAVEPAEVVVQKIFSSPSVICVRL